MSSAVSQSLIDGRFHFAAEMISQCVTDGTELSFLCPIDDEVDWYFYNDMDYDSDSNNEATATFILMSSGNSQGYYEPYEVSCQFENEDTHHAIIIVTGIATIEWCSQHTFYTDSNCRCSRPSPAHPALP